MRQKLVRERGGKYYIEKTKIECGCRFIPMTEDAYRNLKSILTRRKSLKTESIVRHRETDEDLAVVGIDMENDGEFLPEPTAISEVKADSAADIVILVDVDLGGYRRKNDMRAVKKNCTIPSWLNFEAEKAGVNFSAILTAALKSELKIQSR